MDLCKWCAVPLQHHHSTAANCKRIEGKTPHANTRNMLYQFFLLLFQAKSCNLAYSLLIKCPFYDDNLTGAAHDKFTRACQFLKLDFIWQLAQQCDHVVPSSDVINTKEYTNRHEHGKTHNYNSLTDLVNTMRKPSVCQSTGFVLISRIYFARQQDIMAIYSSNCCLIILIILPGATSLCMTFCLEQPLSHISKLSPYLIYIHLGLKTHIHW